MGIVQVGSEFRSSGIFASHRRLCRDSGFDSFFCLPLTAGSEIYASSMPFFFVLAALGIGKNLPVTESAQGQDGFAVTVKTMSIIMGILTVLLPVIILHIDKQPAVHAVSCPSAQIPYAVAVTPGSYIDLVPNDTTACGRVPEICLRDFQQNIASNDPSDQAIYQHFMAWTAGKSLRLFEAQDIVQGEFHFFTGPAADFPNVSRSYVIAGCATKINVPRRPDIYQIQSVSSSVPLMIP